MDENGVCVRAVMWRNTLYVCLAATRLQLQRVLCITFCVCVLDRSGNMQEIIGMKQPFRIV